MRYFSLFILPIFAFLTSHPALADSHSASAEMQILAGNGGWVSQHGSVAHLNFTALPQQNTYSVSGTYVNNQQGYLCQGTPYPLTGVYYSGTLVISFSVDWANATADCQSVTGWTGYFQTTSTGWRLTTNWNLASNGISEPIIQQGNDIFTLQTSVKSDRLIAE